jgi:farnesyl-diphosphate farnesyltransferase
MHWIDIALEHYTVAWEYTQSIPKGECRLRLACIWPIWIGLETLALLRQSQNFLDPDEVIKITRGRIYVIMASSVLSIGSERLLSRHFRQLMNKAR